MISPQLCPFSDVMPPLRANSSWKIDRSKFTYPYPFPFPLAQVLGYSASRRFLTQCLRVSDFRITYQKIQILRPVRDCIHSRHLLFILRCLLSKPVALNLFGTVTFFLDIPNSEQSFEIQWYSI